jgi:hypothetical protein
VARQSIPRSDLYGDLGVDPSADADAIESAYRDLIDPLSASEATADVRRAARLRVAREWLTDPELRSRYDASRARAAARAEQAAAEEAQAFAQSTSDAAATDPAAPDPAAPDPAASPDIPWPVRDLQRESPDIQWSSTPADASDDRRTARRDGRLPLGVLGLVALAAVVMIGTYALATNGIFTNVAANPTATAQGAGASQAAEPSAAATEVPSVAPSVAPSAPPASVAPSGVTADVAAMQQAAWQTLESLRTAAATGDVAAAQAFLGDTADGLRRSGLRRATFPQLDASAITIDSSDTLYLAFAATDRLTSPDGVAWTFDYGDRPLAAYRSPSGEPVHDLWWEETDGRHHLFVQVSVATLSRIGVRVDLRWSFDPARPDDATYFRRSTVAVTTVTFDGTPVAITSSPLSMDGFLGLTATTPLVGVEGVPSRLGIGITFTNPRTATADDRHIETVFTLDVR